MVNSDTGRSHPPQDHAEFLYILKVLKDMMRQKKLSYRQLAEKVGLSESGVKKIFYGEDCSFNRLSQIARALDSRLIDIMDQIDRKRTLKTQFNRDQQDFFLSNQPAFYLFIGLVIERRPLENVREQLRLNSKRTFSILKKLDELKLLKLLPGDEIKLPPVTQTTHFGSGPLLERAYNQWGHELVDQLASPQKQLTGNFVIRGYSLRTESFAELTERLTELDQEFVRKAVREMSTFPSEIRPMRWISLLDQNSLTSGVL